MRTIKDVIYNLIKPRCEGLAAYYDAYREECGCHRGYFEYLNFEEDFSFWLEELKILPIPGKKYEKIVYDFHQSKNKGNYFDGFESIVLPILLEHWSFGGNDDEAIDPR